MKRHAQQRPPNGRLLDPMLTVSGCSLLVVSCRTRNKINETSNGNTLQCKLPDPFKLWTLSFAVPNSGCNPSHARCWNLSVNASCWIGIPPCTQSCMAPGRMAGLYFSLYGADLGDGNAFYSPTKVSYGRVEIAELFMQCKHANEGDAVSHGYRPRLDAYTGMMLVKYKRWRRHADLVCKCYRSHNIHEVIVILFYFF